MGASGDADFAAFYGREFDRLVRALWPLAGAASADIAQDAMVVALRHWPSVATLDVPSAWVLKAARRIAWRADSRQRERPERERRGAAPASLAVAEVGECDVESALAMLCERDATLLRLHHLEDQSIEVVARRLGCSPGAAKVALHRARARAAPVVAGLAGRWVSDRSWTPAAIAAHVAGVSRTGYVEAVVERDLGGVGGRWEFGAGKYALFRDDGLELDRGRIELTPGGFRLTPTLGVGVATCASEWSGERIQVRQTATTEPPTWGVPDWVWASLYYGSGPMTYEGRATSPLVV